MEFHNFESTLGLQRWSLEFWVPKFTAALSSEGTVGMCHGLHPVPQYPSLWKNWKKWNKKSPEIWTLPRDVIESQEFGISVWILRKIGKKCSCFPTFEPLEFALTGAAKAKAGFWTQREAFSVRCRPRQTMIPIFPLGAVLKWAAMKTNPGFVFGSSCSPWIWRVSTNLHFPLAMGGHNWQHFTD